MITKFKLILSFVSTLIILSLFIWIYSLTQRLESEKQKREDAEMQIALTQEQLLAAQKISTEQSRLATLQKQQSETLENMLKEIENAPKSENKDYCSFEPALNITLDRLFQ